MKRKLVLLLCVILSSTLLIRMYCGVYVHDEFMDTIFFIKHRPVWKWKFSSPIGLSDLTLDDLDEESKIEEMYFEEFVRSQGMSR